MRRPLGTSSPSSYRWLRRLVTFLALLAFFLLLARQDRQALLQALRQVSWRAVLLALGCYTAGQIFNTLRWFALLRGMGVDIPLKYALQIYWAGNFAGLFLSSYVGGDGYRAWAVSRMGAGKTWAFLSVFLDRLVNMLSMVLLVPWALWVFQPVWRPIFAASHLPLVAFLPFPKQWSGRWQAIRIWLHGHPRTFLLAFLSAWPSNLLPMCGTFLLARALGIPVSYWQIVAAQTATYWLSLGGWLGLRENGYLLVYPVLGATLPQAGILALLTRLLQIGVALPGGYWLSRYLLL